MNNTRLRKHAGARPLVLASILLASLVQPAAWPSEAWPTDMAVLEQAFPGLSSGPLRAAVLVDMPDGLLLKSGAVEIRRAEIMDIVDPVGSELRAQLDDNLFFLLEHKAIGKLLLVQARKSMPIDENLSDEEAVKRYLIQVVKGISVSEAEMKAYYESNREMLGGALFEQVQSGIRDLLTEKKRQEAADDYLRNLGREIIIEIDRTWVAEQYGRAMNNPVDQARKSGLATMVEFGATGCIPCDMMQPILDRLKKQYGGRLNIVFVHVRKNQILGARYGIRAIPVQVFFDGRGKEFFRHEGFFAEEKIKATLAKMGL
ncbi:MAG: hypothetical protein KKB20_06535 [Proteobacteria bacterium]|nr:hypothetical protein [Pseudomonadota bacterium]